MRFVRRVPALAALLTSLVATPSLGQSISAAGAWQAGPGATGDNTYVGLIDAPANGSNVAQTSLFTMTGWFVDTTADGWPGSDDVQVFVGTMDSGKMLGRGDVGVNRPDIASTLGNPYWSSAGWRAVIDPGALPPGQDTLSVYVHTPSKGWWFSQVNVAVGVTVSSSGELLAAAPASQGSPPLLTVSAPGESQHLSTRTRVFPIVGTATDPKNGARGIDWVEVWLNGEANSDNGSILGVATLNGDGTWSLPFDPGAHRAIDSNLYVYAHSAVTGKKTLVVRHFSLTDRAIDP